MDMGTRRKALGLLTSERVEAFPVLKDFVETATAELSKPSDDAFWNCAAAFQALVTSDLLTQLANCELKKFLENPIHVPLLSFASQLVIAQTDQFQLSVGIINTRTIPPTGRIQSFASHCMLGLGAMPLRIAEYVQPKPFPSYDFRRDSQLIAMGTRMWAKEEVIRLRAGYDMIDFLPERGTTSLLINLSPMTTPIDYAWEYDRDTLHPVRFIPGDSTWSRVDYAIRLIAEMGDSDYLSTLSKLAAEHPGHFVRWSAVCAAVRLDFETGQQLLERALEDTHPHVRNAAKKTIDRFSTTLQTAV